MTAAIKRCFIDVKADSALKGRIIIELSPKTPITSQKFQTLVSSLSLINTKFHRVIKGFIIQGGDLATAQNAPETQEVYFDDENFELEHDKSGILSMANCGPNTNSTQFFITLNRQPTLNGKNVVFGRVLYGMNTIRQIEQLECRDECPRTDVVITNCGLLEDEDFGVLVPDDGDYLPDNVNDHYLEIEGNEMEYLKLGKLVKDAGSFLLKRGMKSKDISDFSSSRLKYLKSIRYIDQVDPLPLESDTLSLEYKTMYAELKVQILGNLALASLNLKDYQSCLEYSSRVLEIHQLLAKSKDGISVRPIDAQKALYRSGTCYFHLGDLKTSLQKLKQALQLGPDAAISNLITTIETTMKKAEMKEKQMYKKMFE